MTSSENKFYAAMAGDARSAVPGKNSMSTTGNVAATRAMMTNRTWSHCALPAHESQHRL